MCGFLRFGAVSARPHFRRTRAERTSHSSIARLCRDGPRSALGQFSSAPDVPERLRVRRRLDAHAAPFHTKYHEVKASHLSVKPRIEPDVGRAWSLPRRLDLPPPYPGHSPTRRGRTPRTN